MAVVLATATLWGVGTAVGQAPAPAVPYPANLAHRSSALPDRIALTWMGDPASTQAVTWRTDPTVATPQAQIAEAQGGPQFTAEAITVPALRSTPVASDLGFPSLFHTVNFESLAPDTKYLYRVGDGANWSEWIEFTTAPEDPEPFSFIYVGDAQNDVHQHWSRVIRRAYSDRPEADLIVHAGDLVNTSTSDKEWGEWFWAAGWIDGMVRSIATPGNHEYSGPVLSPYFRPQFAFPDNGPQGEGPLYDALAGTVYYIDYQDVRFISLNSNSVAAAADTAQWWDIQAQWLESVLAENPNKWTVVTFHHPVFSNSPDRNNPGLRDAWRPLFEKYGVDLVLQGHDHSYARGNIPNGASVQSAGTVYVVSVSGPKMYDISEDNWTGNGAEVKKSLKNTQLYQLIDVSDGLLRYEARTATGEPYDIFEIHKDADGHKSIVEQAHDEAPEHTHEGETHSHGGAAHSHS